MSLDEKIARSLDIIANGISQWYANVLGDFL